jgi:chromosome partitioning protein
MLIAFVNNKGGVGKSTIAVHAAVWLREQGLRVTLLDADAQASSSSWIAQAQPDIRVARLMHAQEIIEQAPRLQLGCDIVIADGPAALGEATVALLGLANRVILPVGPSMMDVNATYQTVRMIYRARLQHGLTNKQDAFTVFNRVQPRTRLAKLAAVAIVKFGLPVAPTVLQLRQAYAEASGLGSVVWRMGIGAITAADEITTLFKTIFDLDRSQAVLDEQAAALRRTHDALILKQRARPAVELITEAQRRAGDHFIASNRAYQENQTAAGAATNAGGQSSPHSNVSSDGSP